MLESRLLCLSCSVVLSFLGTLPIFHVAGDFWVVLQQFANNNIAAAVEISMKFGVDQDDILIITDVDE